MTILQEQLVGKDPTKITFNEITGEGRYKKVNCWFLTDYVIMLVSIVLRFGFLGSDIYTLIQIYALKNWDNFHAISYVPLIVYRVVFTVCIGLSMIFLLIGLGTGIRIYRQNYVIPSYLHTIARELNSLRSYERFSIYESIDTKSTADWFALQIYKSLHYNGYMWLFADSPRQVLNGATIAYAISNSFTNANITEVIKTIADTNKSEAILLSFMTFSFIVWVCYSVWYIFLILASMCVVPSTKQRMHLSFSKSCKKIVADAILSIYEREEKKRRYSMKKKRRFPSVMRDDSVAELSGIEEKGIDTESGMGTGSTATEVLYAPPPNLGNDRKGRSSGSLSTATYTTNPFDDGQNYSYNSTNGAVPGSVPQRAPVPVAQSSSSVVNVPPPRGITRADDSSVPLPRPQTSRATTYDSQQKKKTHNTRKPPQGYTSRQQTGVLPVMASNTTHAPPPRAATTMSNSSSGDGLSFVSRGPVARHGSTPFDQADLDEPETDNVVRAPRPTQQSVVRRETDSTGIYGQRGF